MRTRTVVVACAVALAVLAGCSSDSKDSGSGSTSTTAAEPAALRILVTNDDGYAHEGLDAVVEALRKLPNVEITVSAPAENQSGTGSSTTPGTVTATKSTTKSGYPASAVNGFPADSIAYALANEEAKPDLVVSGINEGQNLGPIASVSGTVGAAKAAAAAGIPAFAASQGLGEGIEYETAARYVVDWVTAHRDEIVAGDAPVDVVNLNVPTCPTGSIRGLKQEPLSTTGNGLAPATDCQSTATEFTGDVDAFLAGFVTVTQLTSTGDTVTSSTTWPATDR